MRQNIGHMSGNPVTIAVWRAAVSDDSGRPFESLVHDDGRWRVALHHETDSQVTD